MRKSEKFFKGLPRVRNFFAIDFHPIAQMKPYGLKVENQEKKGGLLMIFCGANSLKVLAAKKFRT